MCPKEMDSVLKSFLHFHGSYNIMNNDNDIDHVFIENEHIKHTHMNIVWL